MDGCNTFLYKMDEIRTLLGTGARTSMRRFIPLKPYYDRTEQYFEDVKPILYAITQGKAPKDFIDQLTELRHSIYSVVSELIWYALVIEASFVIHFVKQSGNKTPDCFVDSKSTEVRAVMDEISYQSKIEQSLTEEVIGSLKRRKVYAKINEGLLKANIIALDVTGSSLGYSINSYSSQNRLLFPASEAIRQAVNVLNASITVDSYFIPIIVFAQSYSKDQDYLMSVITIQCPVILNASCSNIKVDLSKIHS